VGTVTGKKGDPFYDSQNKPEFPLILKQGLVHGPVPFSLNRPVQVHLQAPITSVLKEQGSMLPEYLLAFFKQDTIT